MTTVNRHYDASELEAYVDGELDAVRSAELAAWLSRHPDAQGVAEVLRYQRAGLHALFDGLLRQPVPPRLLAMLRRREGGSLRRLMQPAQLAWVLAGALLVALSAVLGWFAHGYALGQQAHEQRLQAFLAQVQSAHALYAMVERGETMDQARLDTILDSVTERLEGTIRTPQDEERYHLLDGRLIPTAGGAAAHFLFADPEDRRISLYVGSGWGTELTDTVEQRDGLTYYYWSDGPLTYALAAPVEAGYLREMVTTLYPPDR